MSSTTKTKVKDKQKTKLGHVEGSRKSRVHEAFNAKGQETAWVLGQKLKLKQSTLRSWFSAWGRTDKPKPARKAKAKPKSKAGTKKVTSNPVKVPEDQPQAVTEQPTA